MPDIQKAIEFPLLEAFKFVKIGDLKNARLSLNLTEIEIGNEELVNGIISLDTGLSLFIQGRHPDALEYFKKASFLISLLPDEATKFIINTLMNFTEGITKLLKGDAHGALPYLDISADAIQRLSYFIPGFTKASYSTRATCNIAIARAFMNGGDLQNAKLLISKANTEYEQLLLLLDKTKSEDIPFLMEIYGTRVEIGLLFISLDLQSLEINDMNERLEAIKSDVEKLEPLINNYPINQIQRVVTILVDYYSIMKEFKSLVHDLIFLRLPINKERIQKLQNLRVKLFIVKESAENAGERGQLFLHSINQLIKYRDNLLTIGHVSKSDFGRFAGIISGSMFIMLTIVVTFIIRPSESTALLYFFGNFIMSLIVGFGFGALKFKPLLKLYSEALKTKNGSSK